MVKGFILVGLFIVIVYVYSIRKIKRNKEMIKNIYGFIDVDVKADNNIAFVISGNKNGNNCECLVVQEQRKLKMYYHFSDSHDIFEQYL